MAELPKKITDAELNQLSHNGTHASDNKAQKEAGAIGRGTLEEEAARKEHDRRENLRDDVSSSVRLIFKIITWGFIGLIVSEIWHLITPECWHFLSDQQQHKIETILFSGALAAMAAEYSKKYM